jgi:hypothetical protein
MSKERTWKICTLYKVRFSMITISIILLLVNINHHIFSSVIRTKHTYYVCERINKQ